MTHHIVQIQTDALIAITSFCLSILLGLLVNEILKEHREQAARVARHAQLRLAVSQRVRSLRMRKRRAAMISWRYVAGWGMAGLAVLATLLDVRHLSALAFLLWYSVPGAILVGYLRRRAWGIAPDRSWIPPALLMIALSALSTTLTRHWLSQPFWGHTPSGILALLAISSLPFVGAVLWIEWRSPHSLSGLTPLPCAAAVWMTLPFALAVSPLPLFWMTTHGWTSLVSGLGLLGVSFAVIRRLVRRPRIRTPLIAYGSQWLVWNLLAIVLQSQLH